jgi:archaellin
MHKIGVANVLVWLVLSLVLVACGGGGYTQSGSKTTSHQSMGRGDVTVEISRANGTAEQKIEGLEANPDTEMEVDVTLAVGKGTYKIELPGKDDRVTLALEARDGETVSGHGQMVTDSFGDAGYRVTAVAAENVDYVLEYRFQ